MKLYKEYLGSAVYDKYEPREEVEWSNFWWDCANNPFDKRYLLIGDSTIRMVRHPFADLLHCPVDMIGSSSNMDDLLFVSQVDAFFSSSLYREYDAVFVQMGHHGRIGRDGGDFGPVDESAFRYSLIALVNFLSQFSKRIIIESIFDAVIPQTQRFQKWKIRHHLIPEVKDEKINRITRRKNEIAMEVVQQQTDLNSICSYLDINDILASKQYLHVDHIHYEADAIPFIIQTMKSAL